MPGETKSKRNEGDFYRTPPEIVEEILREWKPAVPPATILEPAAGDGAMLGPLRTAFPDAVIDAFDVAPRHPDIKQRTFFMEQDGRYDLIITNPPFRHALDFAERSLAMLNPGGHLILFLRLQFMASKKRSRFFKMHLPEAVYVLPQRPSFKNGTTDWSDYCWMVWRAGGKRRTFVGRVMRT